MGSPPLPPSFRTLRSGARNPRRAATCGRGFLYRALSRGRSGGRSSLGFWLPRSAGAYHLVHNSTHLKFRAPCPVCTEDYSIHGSQRPTPSLLVIELQEEPAYSVECPYGHRASVILHAQKFEILFDVGACALADGYYREAVASFAASLERFYEFWMRRVLADQNWSPETVKAWWGTMASSSERQLGAYVGMYSATFGRPPTLVDRKLREELRNSAVHKGIIPKRGRAIEFGQGVLDVLGPQIDELKTNLPTFGVTSHWEIIDVLGSLSVPLGARAVTLAPWTMISSRRARIIEGRLEDLLQTAKSNWSEPPVVARP